VNANDLFEMSAALQGKSPPLMNITPPGLTHELSFFLPCVPPKATHHAKKIVRVGKFSRLADKPELVSAREMLMALLRPHQPKKPIAPPIVLSLEFTWPWRGGDSAKTRARGRLPSIVKPDADNSAKLLTDVLVALRFIEADQHIAELTVRKWIGEPAGIEVFIGKRIEHR
jgi:Holliday junction resolvase RusA-like endonuclease